MRHNNMFMLIATVALFAGCELNQLPNVKASGPDLMVAAGDKVRLRGSASDPDGTIQAYRWEQVEGPSVSISNANQASASFVAPKVKGYQVLVFRLTVVDDDNTTATDRVGQVLYLVEIIEAGVFNPQQLRLASLYRVSSACAVRA